MKTKISVCLFGKLGRDEILSWKILNVVDVSSSYIPREQSVTKSLLPALSFSLHRTIHRHIYPRLMYKVNTCIHTYICVLEKDSSLRSRKIGVTRDNELFFISHFFPSSLISFSSFLFLYLKFYTGFVLCVHKQEGYEG